MRLLFVLLGTLALACSSTTAAPQPLLWVERAPGVTYAPFEVGGGDAFAGHAFTIDLRTASVRLWPAGATHQVVDVIAAPFAVAGTFHLAVNASFFDETGKAMGRTVDQGVMLSADRRAPWGALVIDGARAHCQGRDAARRCRRRRSRGARPAAPGGRR